MEEGGVGGIAGGGLDPVALLSLCGGIVQIPGTPTKGPGGGRVGNNNEESCLIWPHVPDIELGGGFLMSS